MGVAVVLKKRTRLRRDLHANFVPTSCGTNMKRYASKTMLTVGKLVAVDRQA